MDGLSDDGAVYASQDEADAANKQRCDDLVKQARERFHQAEEAEAEIRRLADEDIRFRAGEQWDTAVLSARRIDKRPALTINRMPQFERQVTNEQRQSKPAIQVSPVDSAADVDTAEVLQGLIRHIEYDSNADVAYDTGLTSAVRGGFGYIRVVSEYEYEESFAQCLKVKRVRDPFSVYMDPCAQEPDGSDANWAFVVDDGISEEEFKKEYPDASPVSGGWGNRTNTSGRTCQVVEYFYKERVEDELLSLQPMAVVANPMTGMPQAVPVGEPITALKSTVPPEALASMQLLDSRPTHRTKVCWAKIAGNQVVEETEFPSKWIPVVPVLGDELWVGGKRILEGIIRNAKDPQRMYNYWATSITETIALAPKAPWIGYEGQFAGQEKKWAEAASRNVPYLEVRPVTVDGKPAPLPQRNSFDAPIAAMTQAMEFAADDMKATTGIYDAALGNRSNEQTGVAIRARQNQSQTSTLHFSDNLARALRHLGRILIDAIPRVYEGPRVLRILGEDGTEKMVGVNGAPKVQGQERLFDLGTGRYDVTVAMGPSYTSKRQEMVAASMELSRSNPQIAQVIADLMVRNMDWPGAAQMADRLKKLLPPALQEDDGQKPPPEVLAQRLQQSQAQLQAMAQQHEQLVQAVHAAHDELESKAADNATKERIALIQTQAELAKTAATLNSKEAVAILQHTVDLISQRLKLDGAAEPPGPTQPAPQPAPQLPAGPQAPPQGVTNGQ